MITSIANDAIAAADSDRRIRGYPKIAATSAATRAASRTAGRNGNWMSARNGYSVGSAADLARTGMARSADV